MADTPSDPEIIPTLCICPKCRKTHTIYLNWKGRGVPRKFCRQCQYVKKYDCLPSVKFHPPGA